MAAKSISDTSPANVEAAIRYFLGPEKPSTRQVASKYTIHEATLRRIFKQRGVVRSAAPEQKRQVVNEAMSGIRRQDVTQGVTQHDAMRQQIDDAAKEDIDDMQNALDVARSCIRRLKEIVETVSDPREVKAVADANEKAMLTIRKIRGLDAPVDFSNMSDEEVAALARGMAPK